MAGVRRTAALKVRPLKSHKSKLGTNMIYLNNLLYYADAPLKKVLKYSVDDQDILSTVYTKKRSAFAIPVYQKSTLPPGFKASNTIVMSDGSHIKIMDLDNKAEKEICTVEGYESGTIGAATTHNSGTLFFSAVHLNGEEIDDRQEGLLCCLPPGGGIMKLFKGACIVNGLCFNADCTRLFALDKTLNRVLCFNLESTQIDAPETYLDWENEPLLSGTQMTAFTIDSLDRLWIGCSGLGKVIQVDNEKKTVLKSIDIPKVCQLSSMCFGGSDYRDLIVATSYAGLSLSQISKQNNAGHIFVVRNEGAQGRIPTPVHIEMP